MVSSVNEHEAVQEDASNFVDFRRYNNNDGTGFVYGEDETGDKRVQTIRFKKLNWSVENALLWCRRNGWRVDRFEEAKPDPPRKETKRRKNAQEELPLGTVLTPLPCMNGCRCAKCLP